MKNRICVEIVLQGKRYVYNTEIDPVTQVDLFTNIDFCTNSEMADLLGFNYHQINSILEKRQRSIDCISQHIARALQDFISKSDKVNGCKSDEL